MSRNKVVLHRYEKRSYWTDWNGHHYEIWKDSPDQETWCIDCDGEPRTGSYWLRDIRGSIESGDLEAPEDIRCHW